MSANESSATDEFDVVGHIDLTPKWQDIIGLLESFTIGAPNEKAILPLLRDVRRIAKIVDGDDPELMVVSREAELVLSRQETFWAKHAEEHCQYASEDCFACTYTDTPPSDGDKAM